MLLFFKWRIMKLIWIWVNTEMDLWRQVNILITRIMFQEAIVIMLIKCTINIARTFKKPQTIANSNHFLLLNIKKHALCLFHKWCIMLTDKFLWFHMHSKILRNLQVYKFFKNSSLWAQILERPEVS